MDIDTSFDFRSDAAGGDPDRTSPTLRRYHRQLWSRPLADGTPFELDDASPDTYLHHISALGEFWLSSDTVMPTFRSWGSLKHLTDSWAPAEGEAFEAITHTIGGMMVFPANRIGGGMTINGARGFNRKIADRFDLTLECIRRHYRGQASPLGETLERYADFFRLFRDFAGYVDFFLLGDLVTDDLAAVRFFLPFDDFAGPSTPRDVETYGEFRRRSIEFVAARNRRIDALEPRRTERPRPSMSGEGRLSVPHSLTAGDVRR